MVRILESGWERTLSRREFYQVELLTLLLINSKSHFHTREGSDLSVPPSVLSPKSSIPSEWPCSVGLDLQFSIHLTRLIHPFPFNVHVTDFTLSVTLGQFDHTHSFTLRSQQSFRVFTGPVLYSSLPQSSSGKLSNSLVTMYETYPTTTLQNSI